MVPGVPGAVVGRRGIASIGPPHQPVRRSLATGAVAYRTVRQVNLSAGLSLLQIASLIPSARPAGRYDGQQNERCW